MTQVFKVSVIVPVYNPGALWLQWLDAVSKQGIALENVIIIDSSSSDGCVEKANLHGFKVISISQDEFDHGGTRQFALDHIGDADIVVYLTQDAILEDIDSIKNLVDAFDDERVAVACGRQLPNKKANPIEAHARLFNYPESSHVYSLSDRAEFGLKVAFNSNSFSAYRVSALKEAGGFKSKVIFGEDMLAAAELLKNNYKIAYRHSACVSHSHAYSLKQEFQRYFDMGVMHDTQKWLLAELGKPTGEGFRFVRSEISYLMKHSPLRIPEALIRTLIKFIGYRAGLMHARLPLTLKSMFSMNKKYWDR